MNMIGLWQKLDEFEAYIGKTEPNRTTSMPLSREEVLVLTLFVQWLEHTAPEYAAVPAMYDALENLLEATEADPFEIVGRDEHGHPLSALGLARHNARAALTSARGES